MGLRFYKPNKANKGFSLNINISATTDKNEGPGKFQRGDKAFYFNFTAQNGWDDQNGNGIFKDGKNYCVKLSPTECAGIVMCVERGMELKTTMGQEYVYHDNDKYGLTVGFGPAFKRVKQGATWVETKDQNGFRMSCTRKDKSNPELKETFGMSFTYAESELLKQFLIYGLGHINNAIYAEDKTAFAKSRENKEASVKAAPVAAKAEEYLPAETEAEPVSAEDEEVF